MYELLLAVSLAFVLAVWAIKNAPDEFLELFRLEKDDEDE